MSDSHTGTTADADPDAGVDVAFSADAAFAELAALAMSAQPLREILQRTVALARTVVSSTSAVSVTVIAGDDATTPAATADVAVSIDQSQYDEGYGPCLDAARAGEVVAIDDISAERRWPRFADTALA